jgi:phospholipase D-like protein
VADFENRVERDGFTVKLWRGERMCLLGFDVKDPEPDLVGFAIECRAPGGGVFQPLRNRLAFSYGPGDEVNGRRKYLSTQSPFQKFRWVHFPYDPRQGTYTYRVTKMHMPRDEDPVRGRSIDADVSLDPVTYADFVDVGFTRNFASSQAFEDKYGGLSARLIPATAKDGLDFPKVQGSDVYRWLGFEACELVFSFLDEAVKDPQVTLDVLAYDLNEPDIVVRLEAMKERLRIVLDDAGDHAASTSAESKAAARLARSASRKNVKRTHFGSLQHHKVFIARRGGRAEKVLTGSTNLSFRGLYIQANNVLVFRDGNVADLYGKVFDEAFKAPAGFAATPLAKQWYAVQPPDGPAVHLCFSPHTSPDLSLNPLRGAVDQATSSVLYAVAFLNKIKSGPTKEAFDRLMKRSVFSYGVCDEASGLEVRKPNGSTGLVDFAYLARNAPEPFKSEWSGGKGINVHHKFVVTDFSLPSAKVFTGSSNLSPSGEKGNGDSLLMIEDRKIAVAYAIEALRVFDHLHFRSRMQEAKAPKGRKRSGGRGGAGAKPRGPLVLAKPTALSQKPAWFEAFYAGGSAEEGDRRLFST